MRSRELPSSPLLPLYLLAPLCCLLRVVLALWGVGLAWPLPPSAEERWGGRALPPGLGLPVLATEEEKELKACEPSGCASSPHNSEHVNGCKLSPQPPRCWLASFQGSWRVAFIYKLVS